MNTFKIIIPVYNSEKWISICLDSVINQSYKNWKCVIIDDNSTDKTLDVIKEKLKGCSLLSNFKIMHRTLNVGALENIVYGINLICNNDEDIIVLLDGDDWFASNDVLDYLNNVYQTQYIWLTYGQYVNESNKSIGMNKNLNMDTSRYRDHGREYWSTSHLRTFKYKIWKRINNNDLKMSNGKYYPMAWDLAIMYPLIEMCGGKRIKFIEKILYIYNDVNPINDHKKNVLLQISLADEIKNKSKYKEII